MTMASTHTIRLPTAPANSSCTAEQHDEQGAGSGGVLANMGAGLMLRGGHIAAGAVRAGGRGSACNVAGRGSACTVAGRGSACTVGGRSLTLRMLGSSESGKMNASCRQE